MKHMKNFDFSVQKNFTIVIMNDVYKVSKYVYKVMFLKKDVNKC